VIDIIGGGTPKTNVGSYWNGDIPWLSVVDFNTGRKYVESTEKTITEFGLENSSTKILNQSDIVISARGTVGAMAVLKKPMAFNQSCYGIRTKQKIVSQDFLYYLVKSSITNLQQMAYGGVFDTITKETFDGLDVLLPPLQEQKSIASILSNFDDKIDLLYRQNKILEAMAEALFRQWFVEGADEGWEEDSIFQLVDLVGGGTPKTENSNYWDGNIPWLSGGDIASNHKTVILNSEKHITEEGLTHSSTKTLPKYSVIISARGTVGKYCILGEQMAFSQSNYGIIPTVDGCYFFVFLLINYIVEDLKASAYGSVFDTITTDTFRQISIPIPLESEIMLFNESVLTWFLKIERNQRQIHGLEKTRDMLLPRLMSGEVRV
jgi:type I restriction enzyme S subunit